jgi:hypothetical protein
VVKKEEGTSDWEERRGRRRGGEFVGGKNLEVLN